MLNARASAVKVRNKRRTGSFSTLAEHWVVSDLSRRGKPLHFLPVRIEDNPWIFLLVVVKFETALWPLHPYSCMLTFSHSSFCLHFLFAASKNFTLRNVNIQFEEGCMKFPKMKLKDTYRWIILFLSTTNKLWSQQQFEASRNKLLSINNNSDSPREDSR